LLLVDAGLHWLAVFRLALLAPSSNHPMDRIMGMSPGIRITDMG
jgi:hypothetical protein